MKKSMKYVMILMLVFLIVPMTCFAEVGTIEIDGVDKVVMDFSDLEEFIVIGIKLETEMKKTDILAKDLDKVYAHLADVREIVTDLEDQLNTTKIATYVFIGSTAVLAITTVLGILVW